METIGFTIAIAIAIIGILVLRGVIAFCAVMAGWVWLTYDVSIIAFYGLVPVGFIISSLAAGAVELGLYLIFPDNAFLEWLDE